MRGYLRDNFKRSKGATRKKSYTNIKRTAKGAAYLVSLTPLPSASGPRASTKTLSMSAEEIFGAWSLPARPILRSWSGAIGDLIVRWMQIQGPAGDGGGKQSFLLVF